MRQAIEEGFILDVLQNYMTYSTCFKIAKKTEENPELPESRATKAIKKYENCIHTILARRLRLL